MWQDARTAEEKEWEKDETKPAGKPDTRSADQLAEFGKMLSSVNCLYLGCQVLILLDASYISRFWTGYEAWLSMRLPNAEGLLSASTTAAEASEDSRRWTIVPILAGIAPLSTTLVGMWQEQTPKGAIEFLKNPDIGVTNKSDKDSQIDKIGKLDESVKRAFARIKAHDAVKLAAHAALKVNLGALEAAVEAAERAGVRAPALRCAAHAGRGRRTRGRHWDRAVGDGEGDDAGGSAARAGSQLGAAADTKASWAERAEVRKAGRTALQARVAGHTCAEARQAGYKCYEARQAGY